MEAKKKMSLQEAIKQQLENKKKNAGESKSNSNHTEKAAKMKSQMTKKVSNQRRKMGV